MVPSPRPKAAAAASPAAPMARPDTQEGDRLRSQAKQAILSAAATGGLEKALQDMKDGKGEFAADKLEAAKRPVEDLRLEAKNTILKASRDGVLEGVLQEAVTVPARPEFVGKPSVGTWLMMRPPNSGPPEPTER